MSPAKPDTPFAEILREVRGAVRKIDGLADRLTRGEARTDEVVKQVGALAAGMESLSAKVEAADQRARLTRGEMYAAQNRAWQELDKKVEAKAEEAGLTADSLERRLQEVAREVAQVSPAVEAHTEAVAESAAEKTAKKPAPHWRWVLGGSLFGGGGGLVLLIDNAPKAVKFLHALWVGGAAAGGDLLH